MSIRRRLPKQERIGVQGIAWATRYRDGWSVYVPREGIVLRDVTREQANERIDEELNKVVHDLKVTVDA